MAGWRLSQLRVVPCLQGQAPRGRKGELRPLLLPLRRTDPTMRGSANHEEELEMIQHYPNATQVSDLQRLDPPAAVLQAVRVMYAGAGREKLARYAFGLADKVADVTILERKRQRSARPGGSASRRDRHGAGVHRDRQPDHPHLGGPRPREAPILVNAGAGAAHRHAVRSPPVNACIWR